ncbi:hypothetical protein A9Q86_09945 [Flavobacteriales bacterium 33_180_T64]|nr:hypothetical protein A9Q86_09945 [Flavobacteriales bacterium 33_180_T64]
MPNFRTIGKKTKAAFKKIIKAIKKSFLSKNVEIDDKRKPPSKRNPVKFNEESKRHLSKEYSEILKKRFSSKRDVSKLRPFIKVDSHNKSQLIINNLGNTASWNCHVDFYILKSGLQWDKSQPLPGSQFLFKNREIISIQPGQEMAKDIDDKYFNLMPNVVTDEIELLFFVVHDPISDPLINFKADFTRNVNVFIRKK